MKYWSASLNRVCESPEASDDTRELNHFYIVTSVAKHILCGYYGKGYTMDEALKAWHKAGGRRTKSVVFRIHRFTSELPFAAMDDLDSEDNESVADAWVGQDGSIQWVRCGRDIIEEKTS